MTDKPKVVSLHGDPVLLPGVPDPEIVGVLEWALEKAKNGDIDAIAILVRHHDDTFSSRLIGETKNFGMIGALECLKRDCLWE